MNMWRYIIIYRYKPYTSNGDNIEMAKRNGLSPKNIKCLVDDFIKIEDTQLRNIQTSPIPSKKLS